MKNRVLITGASGFVGYHVVEEALNKGLEVFAAVRKSSDISHLKDFNIHFTYPNFGEIKSLVEDFSKNRYDYIIHLAGLTKAITEDEYNNGTSYDWNYDTLKTHIYDSGNTFGMGMPTYWVNRNNSKTGLNLFSGCTSFATTASYVSGASAIVANFEEANNILANRVFR